MKFPVLCALLICCATLVRGEEPASFAVGGLVFQRPADWAWVPVTSQMRKAQLRVPGATATEGADIVFSHFGPGNGGNIESNAQRWLGQLKGSADAAKIEPREVAGTKFTLISTEGTFSSGMRAVPRSRSKIMASWGPSSRDRKGMSLSR